MDTERGRGGGVHWETGIGACAVPTRARNRHLTEPPEQLGQLCSAKTQVGSESKAGGVYLYTGLIHFAAR